jgi:hypothetical protein
MAEATKYMWRDVVLGLGGWAPQLGLKAHQTGDDAAWQILDVSFFRRFPLTEDEFWHKTGAIGRSI